MEIVASETLPERPSALPDTWVEKLFQKMEDRYGAMWADRYGNMPRNRVKATWAEDLAGFTGDELRRGMDVSKRNKFPPTLPEFLNLCRPDINAETAFHEAVIQLGLRKEGKDSWSNKAIYWAAQAIGSSDMLNATWKHVEKRWTSILSEKLSAQSLPEIPAYAVALPPPGQTTIAPEEGKRRVAEAVKSINAPADHKAWANRLIWRQIHDADKPHPTALRMAQEVMGEDYAPHKPVSNNDELVNF